YKQPSATPTTDENRLFFISQIRPVLFDNGPDSFSEHQRPVRCHSDRVLEMHTGQPVCGDDCPVIIQDPYVFSPHVDHRLDSEHQAVLDREVPLADILGNIVGNLWLLMHLAADAMADEIEHGTETRPIDIPLHHPGHLRPLLPGRQTLNRDFQSPPSRLEQSCNFVAHVADRIRPSPVTAPALDLATGVDADDIPFTQLAVTRDAVHHFF